MTGRDRLAEALRRHLREHPPTTGVVHRIEVRHDDDCGYWRDGRCNCRPEITSAPLDPAELR
jgi:hypothetical protein